MVAETKKSSVFLHISARRAPPAGPRSSSSDDAPSSHSSLPSTPRAGRRQAEERIHRDAPATPRAEPGGAQSPRGAATYSWVKCILNFLESNGQVRPADQAVARRILALREASQDGSRGTGRASWVPMVPRRPR
jgi:hypothetical protein